MRLGIAFDLKEAVHREQDSPEDALEEYDSPETVEAIASALKAQGYSAVKLGGGRDFLRRILSTDVHLVFNIAEGMGSYRSREAQVPSILEMFDVPYTGSDPQCLAVCLDKPLTKKLVALAGVCTPRWQVIADERQAFETDWTGFPVPAFIKPTCEGSSKGIRLASRVQDAGQIPEAALRLLKHYRQPVMVEAFIPGDEVTVGLVGNSSPRILGIMRILPKQKTGDFIYSLEVKRDWESLVEYECPARLEKDILDRIEDYSLKAFETLGCRDFARVDFRLSPDGVPHFLEINPLAGLNPKSSDLCLMAYKMGWSYEALISAILSAALERYPQCVLK